jgi:glutathione S-transferase
VPAATQRTARAQVLQWLFFEQYSHEPYVATPRYIVRHLPPDSPRRAELPDRLARGRQALDVMEQHLSQRPFFVAERYSIADIAMYAYTHVADQGGHDLAPYPAIRAWLGRVAAQPRYVPITAVPQG